MLADDAAQSSVRSAFNLRRVNIWYRVVSSLARRGIDPGGDNSNSPSPSSAVNHGAGGRASGRTDGRVSDFNRVHVVDERAAAATERRGSVRE